MEYGIHPTPSASARDEKSFQHFSGSYDLSHPKWYEPQGAQIHPSGNQIISIHDQQTASSRERPDSVTEEAKGGLAQLDSTTGEYLQHEDDKAIVAAVQHFAQGAAPPPYFLSSLDKPVAIPQLTQSKTTNFMAPPGSGASSYARIYPPSLMQHGISEMEFLTFIDGLNTVCTSSQKLQALSLANTVMSLDPSGSMQMVSMAVGVGAQAVQQKVFDRRAAVYLNRANIDFFHPRGLYVRKCTLHELRGIAHIPEDAPLRVPFDTTTICSSVAENLARALQPWLAPLKFDVPPLATPGSVNTIQKLNNFQAKHMNKQLERDLISYRLRELSRTNLAVYLHGFLEPALAKALSRSPAGPWPISM